MGKAKKLTESGPTLSNGEVSSAGGGTTRGASGGTLPTPACSARSSCPLSSGSAAKVLAALMVRVRVRVRARVRVRVRVRIRVRVRVRVRVGVRVTGRGVQQ